MKKQNLWLIASLFAGAMLTTACSNSGETDPNPPYVNPSGGISDGTAVKPANMRMSALSGFVYDNNGNPLQNVQVISGSEYVISGRDGGFVLDNVNSVNGRTVVKFVCSGYNEITRSMPTVSGDVWEVTMTPTWGAKVASSYESPSTGVSLNASGMKVEMEPNGFKFADGEALGMYDYVSTQVVYLSPDDKDFATTMPGGDLAAVRTDNSEVQLVSYGMVNVNLTSNGKKVQPADGKPATLTFPVPEKFKNGTLPESIPLWSFNEQTGLWEEEGVATYDSQENVYKGQVTHFSWVNLDYPEARATLKVNVKDQAGNVIPNQVVDIDGQRSYTTNKDGVAEGFVPINTDFYVTVRSRDYSNYSPEVKINVEKLTSAGATKTIDIVLPTMVHISGKVVNSGKGNNLSSLWIDYNGKATKAVHTDADGQFIINAPFDYTGAAELVLLASDGSVQKFDITLDGKDHAYTLSIKTDTATGGKITYTPTGGTPQNILINPIYSSDFEGVEIVDNVLSCSTNGVSLKIENYSENKTSYNNAYVNIYTGNSSIMNDAANAIVKKNEYNNYTINISGDAKTQRWKDNSPVYETVGSISGEFSAPLLGKGKTFKPVTKKESFFPSFTPWIDGKNATIGLQITECPFYGTGVLLWYFDINLNYNDYLAFKELAKKALGEPVLSSDSGPDEQGYQDMCVSYFYKDGKYIMVSYCPWREGDGDNFESMSLWCLRENHAARIQVHALEGLKASPEELMMVHGK